MNEITDYKIYNFGADTKDLGAMDNDCFTQNSNTLVVGEQFNISEIKYKKGDSTSSITTGFTISSSDTSVIDVTSSGLLGKKLIASSKGTARIKIDYMGTTKEVTVTVKDEERRFDSININERTVTAYKGEQTIIRVSAVDQYGDPITAKVLSDADINVDPFENGSVTPLANGTLGSKGSQGEVQWKLIPGSVGSGTICFKNKKGDIIGKIYLNVKERA
ncbi:MAG: hypothetical protein RR645_00995 [Clostridium sp.]